MTVTVLPLSLRHLHDVVVVRDLEELLSTVRLVEDVGPAGEQRRGLLHDGVRPAVSDRHQRSGHTQVDTQRLFT
jgi:hypothetical protein